MEINEELKKVDIKNCTCHQGGLNKKEIHTESFCNIFSILIYNKLYLFL